MPKARFKPTSPKKSLVDGGSKQVPTYKPTKLHQFLPQVMITRGLAALAGALTVGLAILTSSGLSGVLQLGNTAMSVFAGPLLALFVLGFFTHTANRIVKTFWTLLSTYTH